MIDLASLDDVSRKDLFRATSQQMKLDAAFIEKDFWICWVLEYLFGRSSISDKAAFKGGTSLSKGYGLIRRMSEDIDVILDWRLLGYGLDEPWEERGSKKQRAFIEEMHNRATTFIGNTLLFEMRSDFKDFDLTDFSLEIVPSDPQTIRFYYPQAFSEDALLQEIRIEAGALSAWTPAETIAMTSYAENFFSDMFVEGEVKVRTVLSERTFWEKVTILHKESFREVGNVPNRYSRHYYDVYELSNSATKDRAFKDVDLLERVVSFNSRFYRSAFAHYELAKPGTLRLMPPEASISVLERDYAAMRPMVYGDYPSFSEILESLKHLEDEINFFGECQGDECQGDAHLDSLSLRALSKD
ncbi:MAG: nucleotidyl transferase AbiEii/AbiGii toxin family protein [Coriobacteriales bacterium]|jgi:predicted nucleotidyltransferase component of viral defense system|nr:nucleotidyl transferase AbiEii/AbiGii toxin family protein [Coriobacteriales bacterium]